VVGAIIIGLIGGMVGFVGVSKLKRLFKVDDSLDAFWVHGLVGIWGSIATALFVAPYLKAEDYSLGSQMVAQIEAIGLTVVYSGVMTALIFFISSALTGGGRVDEETEFKGLDEATHGEKAINL
jgi:Amt family ammonium transporter